MRIQHDLGVPESSGIGNESYGILGRARLGGEHWSQSVRHGDFTWWLKLKNMSQLVSGSLRTQKYLGVTLRRNQVLPR